MILVCIVFFGVFLRISLGYNVDVDFEISQCLNGVACESEKNVVLTLNVSDFTIQDNVSCAALCFKPLIINAVKFYFLFLQLFC